MDINNQDNFIEVQNQNIMKTILCPTDFTPASLNAVRYAFELNKTFKSKIILFHAYYVPVPTTDLPAFIPDAQNIRQEALNRLSEIRDQMKNEFPTVTAKVELQVAEGNPVTGIEEMQKDQEVSLIISGTRGASGLRKFLAGSNSARFTVKSACPVITVPDGSKFRPFNKIVFATNYAEGDFENIEQVIDFAKPFNAQVIMLHISTGNLDKTAEFASIEHFKERIAEDSHYANLTFKLMESKNIEEGLLNYLDEVKADLIAMTNRHRSFFQKFFERSLTKQVAFDTHTPLLAFHEAEQEVYL